MHRPLALPRAGKGVWRAASGTHYLGQIRHGRTKHSQLLLWHESRREVESTRYRQVAPNSDTVDDHVFRCEGLLERVDQSSTDLVPPDRSVDDKEQKLCWDCGLWLARSQCVPHELRG